MGHVVSPIAFRLNFSKYWLNLHSEKKNSNYLNFSDYVLLVSLKRLLKKRIFFRFKLVFDKLIFIHRFWQDLLMIKFKYSKYKITKKSKKKIIRNKKKKKIIKFKKKNLKC